MPEEAPVITAVPFRPELMRTLLKKQLRSLLTIADIVFLLCGSNRSHRDDVGAPAHATFTPAIGLTA
jgi:hypothetical protein